MVNLLFSRLKCVFVILNSRAHSKYHVLNWFASMHLVLSLKTFFLFVLFIITLLGCAVTCKPELSRPLKATAVPGIWTGQKLIGPMAVWKHRENNSMECIRISHIKYVNFSRSSQSSNNDPMELRSGVTTQMTLHCVLMTWDVVAG